MKPSVSLDDTRRVLADIEAVVLQVELARTAAAVERAIAVTAPGLPGCDCLGDCDDAYPYRDSLTYWFDLACNTDGCDCMAGEYRKYAPEVVSPHLFEEGG